MAMQFMTFASVKLETMNQQLLPATIRKATRFKTANRAFEFQSARKSLDRKRPLVCKVCGDAASGYNFGAVVCESCKSFYRRHVSRSPSFMCAASGTCMLNHRTRRHCPACRMEKCFAVGMWRPSTSEHEHEHQLSSDAHSNTRRYNLFVRRLLQRVKSRHTTTNSKDKDKDKDKANTTQSRPEEDVRLNSVSARLRLDTAPAATLKDDSGDYEQLYERISAASKSMLTLSKRSAAGQQDARTARTASVSLSESVVLRLAMSGYMEALQQFKELARLDRSQMRLMLREQMLDQLNLYSMFAVNCDTSGWYAVDAAGVPREQAFADFVQCLTREGEGESDGDGDGDGVQGQVQCYVESFLALVRTLRVNFEHDWPVVLLTVTVVNLLSAKQAVQHCAQVDELRLRYERFLESYLRRKHWAKFDALFYYCTDKFPNALRRLVQVQRCMIAQLALKSSCASPASSMSSSTSTISTEESLSHVGASTPVCVLLEPLVTFLVDCISLFG